MDWTPVVAALAAFVALQGPAVANLLLSWSTRVRVDQNGSKLQQVHNNTNGTIGELRGEIEALRKEVAAQSATLERLHSPPEAHT